MLEYNFSLGALLAKQKIMPALNYVFFFKYNFTYYDLKSFTNIFIAYKIYKKDYLKIN